MSIRLRQEVAGLSGEMVFGLSFVDDKRVEANRGKDIPGQAVWERHEWFCVVRKGLFRFIRLS